MLKTCILGFLIVVLEVGSAATWISYMASVERPVTLVTNNLATRQNGTCCNPSDPNDCTICPDDPNAKFRVLVCLRPGFGIGVRDESDCPLGRTTQTPNLPPGAVLHLTPRPEAALLEREHTGSLQLYARITAIVDEIEVHVDDAWVFGFIIPADGIFRRIARLSFKQVAIVGVNVKVQCTDGAETENCSVPTATTALSSTPDATMEDIFTTQDIQSDTPPDGATTLMGTVLAANTQLGNIQTQSTAQGGSEASSSNQLSAVSVIAGLCIGGLVAAAVTVVLFCLIACYIRKHYKLYPTNKDPSDLDMDMSDNPLYTKTTKKDTEDDAVENHNYVKKPTGNPSNKMTMQPEIVYANIAEKDPSSLPAPPSIPLPESPDIPTDNTTEREGEGEREKEEEEEGDDSNYEIPSLY